MGYQLGNYTRLNLNVESGKGCSLFDTDGRRYLDMITGIGVNAFGWCHPRITKVLVEQAAKCVHTSNLVSHQPQQTLAEKLCQLSGHDRAFFSNSGTEAMEAALKAVRARSTPGKSRIVALHRSFHGRTLGSLTLTGQPDLRQRFPFPGAEVTFIEPNDIGQLQAAIGWDTAALVLEPVLGEGGIYPLDIEYLQAARALTRAADAYLVADEVQCGLGRTGKPFAYQWAGILPDIALTAKPLAAGLPLGATLFTEDAAQWLPPHSHGSTFGGGPLACRVGAEVVDMMQETLPHINEIAAYFRTRLEAMQHSSIREVRAKGLMLGIQLDRPGTPFVHAALQRGVLLNCTQETVLRMLPPYIITKAEVDQTIDVLEEILPR